MGEMSLLKASWAELSLRCPLLLILLKLKGPEEAASSAWDRWARPKRESPARKQQMRELKLPCHYMPPGETCKEE